MNRVRCAIVAGAFLSTVVAGCTTAPIDPNAIAREVGDRERAFARTMAQRDFDSFSGFIAEEAIFFNGREALRGRAAVAQAWRRFYTGKDAPFSWEPDSVEVLSSGTLALSTGPVRDGTGKLIARFNSVWRKDPDGVWRVVFDRGSPVCDCAPATP